MKRNMKAHKKEKLRKEVQGCWGRNGTCSWGKGKSGKYYKKRANKAARKIDKIEAMVEQDILLEKALVRAINNWLYWCRECNWKGR